MTIWIKYGVNTAMNEPIFAVGNILSNKYNHTRYRVISILDDTVVLCLMDTSKFELAFFDIEMVTDSINDESIIIEKDEDAIIFDSNVLSKSARKKFETKFKLLQEVVNIYGPSYARLYGKHDKPELKELLNKYDIAKNSFWRLCTRYFQSGMKPYSLLDKKSFGVNKGKTYQYTNKPGQKSKYVESNIYLDEQTLSRFEEALADYKSGRQKTLRNSFQKMNMKYYTMTELIDGVSSYILMPESERPTLGQFYYYAQKHLTKAEKDLIKTSAAEQRNNKRLLISDSLKDVYGPADMVEIDACEADVSLVSELDPDQAIGRPIVYFMIDVYSRIILAVSVAFDNNSILGITNLFLNLADDKLEYCKKYGIEFNDKRLWPSGIIPKRIRVDRGSEFKSYEFDRICNEIGIEKQIVSGASGSLKGVVEQAFHQMHAKQNVHLENHGLIEKRYDSLHHKEASLTIHDYTRMVINFVLAHNQQHLETYPLTKEMIEKNIAPVPAILWEYGSKKYGMPQPIPVLKQYLYSLMTPIKAKISKRGISYKGLWYFAPNDKRLMSEMYAAGTRRMPFEVRMDMRDVGAIYYIRNSKLVKIPLNVLITGNSDYKGLTMKQYEEYYRAKKKMQAKGRIDNEKIDTAVYANNESIVKSAKKNVHSRTKDIRSSREIDKQKVSYEGKISTRLESKDETSKNISADEQKENGVTEYRDYASFEEALQDFYDNN
jgi:hypothetical protein